MKQVRRFLGSCNFPKAALLVLMCLAALGMGLSNAEAACSTFSISSGSTLSGSLTSGDCDAPHRSGSKADLYTFPGTAGQQVTIRMQSSFDTYLFLIAPNGSVVASNDDCTGDGYNSCIPINALQGGTFSLPSSGTYTIEATSYATFATGGSGSYTVSLFLTGTAACSVSPIPFGNTVSGNLSSSDCDAPHRSGSKADLYTFSGIAGQQVTIRMQSSFDTYLFLVGPSGSVVTFNDDCPGDGYNSCIPDNTLQGGTFSLPSSGTYTIEATSYSPSVTGSYTLSLQIVVPAADLIVESLSVSPTTVTAGSDVTVFFSIRNLGGQGTLFFSNDIRLSLDNAITPSDTLLGNRNVSSLAAGSSTGTLSQSITIPSNTTPGNYFIGIIADSSGTVLESNEVNNTAGVPLTVTVPTVSWVNPPPPSMTSGQTITVVYSVSGGGSVTHRNVHWSTGNPTTLVTTQTCEVDNPLNCSTTSPDPQLPSGVYAGTFSVPSVLTPTTLNFAAHAIVNGVNVFSPINSVTINPSLPTAPSALTATSLSSSQISLAWTDNSSNETGFKIERRLGTSGSFTQIATQGANLNFYNDTSVSPSTQYCYWVRATNSAGDSGYSNEACATTPAALTVSTITISLDKTSVVQNGTITGSGSITGTGNGTITSHWIARKPGGIFTDSGPLTTTMTNGNATIPAYSGLPTDTVGVNTVFVRVTDPSPIKESNSLDYTVTAALPDLVVQGSVTASPNPVTAGNNVTISYTVRNQGDSNAGTSTTRIQIRNASTNVLLTDDFFPTPAVGAKTSINESRSINIPASAPGGAYTVYIVLDSNNMLGQSDTSNDFANGPLTITAAKEYGTTVITHGYQFFASSPPEWTVEMACAIRERAGKGKVLIYRKANGLFEPIDQGEYPDVNCPENTNDGEVILIFDWASESDNIYNGFSEAAGDALFVALIRAKKNDQLDLNNLHFIGHSRGTAVNSEAVERLLTVGFAVKHVTNLDPHDWGALNTFADDFDVNEGLSIGFPENHIPNSGVVSWIGTEWADTYWQLDLGVIDNNNDGGLSGREVQGTYYRRLDEDRDHLRDEDDGFGHSDVHRWYLGTIRIPSFPQGYYHSRLGGGWDLKPQIEGNPVSTRFSFADAKQGIINGDFSRDGSSIPEWSRHGGGGDGTAYSSLGYGRHLALGLSSESKTHNWFYIPNNAIRIWFFYKVWQASSSISPDRLYVSLGGGGTLLLPKPILCGTEGTFEYIELDHVGDYRVCSVDVTSFRDSVEKLKFEIAAGGDSVDSVVWIDNVSFQVTGSMKLNVLKKGSGTGLVRSTNFTGIDCGEDCSSNFGTGAQVTLAADADAESTFVGWSGGGCTGKGTCTVTMNSPLSVTATFVANNTSVGTNVSVQPVDATTATSPVILTFSSVSQDGITSLTRSSSGSAPPSGFKLGSPATYYDLTTTAVFSGALTVCINYSGVSFQNEGAIVKKCANRKKVA